MEDLKMFKWTWENGTVTYARGYDRTEKAVMVRKYGKLISKTKI
jgi:hypothetical protein